MMFTNYSFIHPQWFWLLALLPLALAWYIWQHNRRQAQLRVSHSGGFKGKSSLLGPLRHALFALRLLALATLILALARPQTVDISSKVQTSRGIDIVMSVDISGSMLAKDLKPNRLEALKKVAADFVRNRPNDRIGLVLYAAESFTRVPVTADKEVVLKALADVKYETAIKDGTAIGMGLATAINRLKDSKAKSKVIILLTDGVNNTGFIEPITASEMAARYGIKVYTIGIGTNGMAEFPYAYAPNGGFLYRKMPVEIDEKLMQQIARNTEGKYFRATDNRRLQEIYDEINRLETTEVSEKKFYHYDEKFRPFLMLALGLLLLEFLLRHSLFRSFI